MNDGEEQLSLFDNVETREKEMKLAYVMDEIRSKFGKNSILRESLIVMSVQLGKEICY